MNLYQEEILDHYKHPRNKKKLDNPTKSVEVINPLCGDKLSMEIKVENGIISDVGFLGDGCAISQAAMSMLTEEISGKSQEYLNTLKEESILEMLGVEVGPGRLKCAMLCFRAVQKMI
jgi:nitrogen fixation NifU-like protein